MKWQHARGHGVWGCVQYRRVRWMPHAWFTRKYYRLLEWNVQLCIYQHRLQLTPAGAYNYTLCHVVLGWREKAERTLTANTFFSISGRPKLKQILQIGNTCQNPTAPSKKTTRYLMLHFFNKLLHNWMKNMNYNYQYTVPSHSVPPFVCHLIDTKMKVSYYIHRDITTWAE